MPRLAKSLITVSSALLLWQSQVSAQDRCFRIAASAGAGATAELMEIGAHIFSTAHFCATMLRLPQNRVRSMIEAGEIDGEVAIDVLPIDSDGYAMVPTPIADWEADLFWTSDQAEPIGAGSSVGMVLGQDWARLITLQRGSSVFEVRDNRQLFEMLSSQRVQGIILPRISAEHFRTEYPILQQMRSRKIADLSVILRLRDAHPDVITALNQSIRTLRGNGYITGVLNRYAR